MFKTGVTRNILQNASVLVVDDDVSLCSMLTDILSMEGAAVSTAYDGSSALKVFYEEKPDLVILDVNMPGIDGWEVCRQIRLLSNVPVLMLTTNTDNHSVVFGLDKGADDYMTKPFSMEILLARCRALLRRRGSESQETSRDTNAGSYHDNYLSVDLVKHRVNIEGQPVSLTAKEFEILAYLVNNRGHLKTYEEILGAVWGDEYRDSIDYIHVYLSRLRQKIEKDAADPIYLVTERGLGCRFEGLKR